MYCIYCGRLCDFQDDYTCKECKERITRVNQRVYIISLLAECYPYIPDIALRIKVEAIIFPTKPLV